MKNNTKEYNNKFYLLFILSEQQKMSQNYL